MHHACNFTYTTHTRHDMYDRFLINQSWPFRTKMFEFSYRFLHCFVKHCWAPSELAIWNFLPPLFLSTYEKRSFYVYVFLKAKKDGKGRKRAQPTCPPNSPNSPNWRGPDFKNKLTRMQKSLTMPALQFTPKHWQKLNLYLEYDFFQS